jgi:hypothetical protein
MTASAVDPKPAFELNQQIEDMRARLLDNARNEQILLRALAQTLDQVDQRLLEEVRQVTADHEARRSNILGELQLLATRLCVFPKPLSVNPPRAREQVTTLYTSQAIAKPVSDEPSAQPTADAPDVPPPVPLNARNGKARHAPGDWRQAASNIDQEIDLYFEARAVG